MVFVVTLVFSLILIVMDIENILKQFDNYKKMNIELYKPFFLNFSILLQHFGFLPGRSSNNLEYPKHWFPAMNYTQLS